MMGSPLGPTGTPAFGGAPPEPMGRMGMGASPGAAPMNRTLMGAGPMQLPGTDGKGSSPSDVNAMALEDDEEAATMVAQVPEELLAQSAELAAQVQDAEERHYREVFDEFVATKKRCGEATQSLTFDKFVQTLRKNRDQIVSRHGATRVRFTVYVKEGRAALKATPDTE
jgi:hypothetical protein